MSKNTLLEAKRALEEGQIIALPTDTVYGLGISPMHAHTLDALYKLKKRDIGKPIAWLMADAKDISIYGSHLPTYAIEFAHLYWPGALTLVVKASSAVPRAFQSEAGTIGLRVPNHEMTRALIRLVGSPLAVTSANVSGDEAACSLATLDPYLCSHIALALPDDGAALSGIASTVVDCTEAQPRIIRQGDIHISC